MLSACLFLCPISFLHSYSLGPCIENGAAQSELHQLIIKAVSLL